MEFTPKIKHEYKIKYINSSSRETMTEDFLLRE